MTCIQQHQYTILINQPQNCQSCIILGLKAKPINPRLVFSLAFAATETTLIHIIMWLQLGLQWVLHKIFSGFDVSLFSIE
jgi:hypothetical protein